MKGDVAEIKSRLNLPEFLQSRYGVEFKNGKASCLLKDRHVHGDRNPSMLLSKDEKAVRCLAGDHLNGWADVFAVLQKKDGLTFLQAKQAVADYLGMNPNGNGKARTILRRFEWCDALGSRAYKLRWNSERNKFSWSTDQDGKHPGIGACKPTVRHLERISQAQSVMLVEGERDDETLNALLSGLNPTDTVIQRHRTEPGMSMRNFSNPSTARHASISAAIMMSLANSSSKSVVNFSQARRCGWVSFASRKVTRIGVSGERLEVRLNNFRDSWTPLNPGHHPERPMVPSWFASILCNPI